MKVKTRIFELPDNGYRNLSELAHAMGISVSQIYRVREGKRQINQKFIVGAIKAFPNHKLDDLFFILSPGHHLLIILIQAYQADEPITEEKQPAEFKEPFLNNSRLIVKKLAFLINHVT